MVYSATQEVTSSTLILFANYFHPALPPTISFVFILFLIGSLHPAFLSSNLLDKDFNLLFHSTLPPTIYEKALFNLAVYQLMHSIFVHNITLFTIITILHLLDCSFVTLQFLRHSHLCHPYTGLYHHYAALCLYSHLVFLTKDFIAPATVLP